jgi:hypothetical protein
LKIYEGHRTEKEVQLLVEEDLRGKHTYVPHGRTDVVSDDVLCEIKRWDRWHTAIGQISHYNFYYDEKENRIHFFGAVPINKATIIVIFITLRNAGITMTYESYE